MQQPGDKRQKQGDGHNTQWITSANREHATAVVLTTTEF